MVKRWLANRKKSMPALRRSFIVWTLVIAALVLFFCKPSWFWPGGFGIDKGETVTTERVEKDAKGIPVKTTTKRDDGKTLWDWMSLLGVPFSLAVLGYWLQQNQQRRAEVVAKEQKERDEKIAFELRERDEKLAKEQRELAADETKEEVLQVYFDRLSALLVDKNLLSIASKVNATETQEAEILPTIEAMPEAREQLDVAVKVIRARTLSILRRFENDPERKASVIRFLTEADIVIKLQLSLSRADLSRANLIGAYLPFVNLTRADLSGADLRDAHLISAKLSRANLRDADLIRAHLFSADLSDADLSGADLSSVNLIGADLSNAKLNGAKLSNATLRGANLFGADLGGANLSNSNLSDAHLIVANLRGADLSGAKLSRADLSGANLSGTNLARAIFSDNPGLSDASKAELKARGAIFEDSP